MQNQDYSIKWDYEKGTDVPFFDFTKTYEHTGYRPISATEGLDFNPDWFRQAAINKLNTGRYTNEIRKSRRWRKFWEEEQFRCLEGLTVNGYRITGDHYFFLNYYPIPVIRETSRGKVREVGLPYFLDVQYEYFHYLELCQILGKDSCVLKARGIGFSEIGAALGLNMYTFQKDSICIYTASTDTYLSKEGVFTKVNEGLNYLNQATEGAFKRLRQKIDQNLHKKASKVDKSGEELIDSHNAELIGLVVDTPRKLRGARVQRLFFEEAGSYNKLIESYITGEPLVEVMGDRFGTRIVWGTGGDEGPSIEGLEKMFTNPNGYKILPVRHNFTTSGDYVESGFFVPAYRLIIKFMDSRGVTDWDKAKEYYNAKREALKSNPEEYLHSVAEYCFTPEEALSQKGSNRFNREKLAKVKADIVINKIVPKPSVGFLDWEYVGTSKKIRGIKWREDPAGNIKIIEHPVKDEKGNKLENLYVAGIDSIDQGTESSVVGEKGSSFAIVVKKRTWALQGDVYVCMYKERPQDERIAYENSLKILYYYNCCANLEDSKRTIISYYKEQNQLWRLIRRPAIALNNPDARKRSNLIGTPTSTKMINHQLNLIAQYVEDFSQNIFFLDLVEELLNYSYEKKTKFDLVAAMGLAEVYDEELSDISPQSSESFDEQWADIEIGYYFDNSGARRYGIKPRQQIIEQTIIQQSPIRYLDRETGNLEFEW